MTVSPSRYLAILRITDCARSLRFYADGLGLAVHDVWKRAWVELWCGDRLLALWTGEESDAALLPPGWLEAKPSGFVAFRTEGLDALVAAVLEHGGSILEAARPSSHGRMALVADPDGNAILLHEPSRALPGW
jgi:predicted enzyme related to lactoylglutathione lyase